MFASSYVVASEGGKALEVHRDPADDLLDRASVVVPSLPLSEFQSIHAFHKAYQSWESSLPGNQRALLHVLPVYQLYRQNYASYFYGKRFDLKSE